MTQNPVQEFEKLLEVTDQLMGPDGCPWDREQTLVSMRGSVMEEACEVIEAIDEEDDALLVEELGDLLYNVVFFAKLGEKEKRFRLEDAVRHIREKLISRHPHVFGDSEAKDMEAIVEQWERIKKEEKSERESLMDGIPKGMPALARAFKMAKASYPHDTTPDAPSFETEEELGALLWALSKRARKQGFNPEVALRKHLTAHEKEFRAWESSD